jgi:hypothetical protein
MIPWTWTLALPTAAQDADADRLGRAEVRFLGSDALFDASLPCAPWYQLAVRRDLGSATVVAAGNADVIANRAGSSVLFQTFDLTGRAVSPRSPVQFP